MYPKNPARELIQCLGSDHYADSENQKRSGKAQRRFSRSLPKPRSGQTPLLRPPDPRAFPSPIPLHFNPLVHHRAGRYLDEIDLLRKLLATREFTTWIGSYEITNYKHALMRIGRVYFEDLRDYAAAVAVFRDFPGRFPLSRYKDDALWWLGHALTRAGKPAAGKAAHARLLKEYPESKYSRRVRQRRAPP